MKEKIIEILGKIGRPKDLDDINSTAFWLEDAVDEILKIVEWEQLCNPDEAEASMNESVMLQNYVDIEEYNHAVNTIGELQEQIKDMKEDLRLSRQDRSGEYGW